jgi:hypothetical protein
VTSGRALSSPLGLAIAPNGHVPTVNGGNGKIVETTPGGVQVATRLLDSSGSPAGAGALFGLAVAPHGRASTTWTTRPTRCGCRARLVPRQAGAAPGWCRDDGCRTGEAAHRGGGGPRAVTARGPAAPQLPRPPRVRRAPGPGA